MHLTPTEYAAEMRRLETMRNEAIRRRDHSALAVIRCSENELNVVFWGREPRRG